MPAQCRQGTNEEKNPKTAQAQVVEDIGIWVCIS